MANYLKKYYLDDAKLAQRARLEFAHALRTGRMVAFVGSMATQAFGFGDWRQLRMLTAWLASVVVECLEGSGDGDLAEARETIRFLNEQASDGKIDAQAAMSLIEEVLDRPRIRTRKVDFANLGAKLQMAEFAPPFIADPGGDHIPRHAWPLDQVDRPVEVYKVLLAMHFRQPNAGWRIDREIPGCPAIGRQLDQLNVPALLWNRLGIRRFVTTNYDFEIERIAMVSSHVPSGEALAPNSAFAELVRQREGSKVDNFNWDLGSGRIRRVFEDGWAIESDLLNRERIDRMIEFAVGTDDVDGHIFHLHGRADDWQSMIVSLRDYDRLYRRNDLNRAPFELAKRMMMGGNPILFVGLGMGERELNREMEEFISNTPYQRVAPTFVLWSAGPDAMNAQQQRAKRLDLLRRLGVMTIFDTDLGVSHSATGDSATARIKTAFKGLETQFQGLLATSDIAAGNAFRTNMFDHVDAGPQWEALAHLARSVDALASSVGSGNCPSLREMPEDPSWRTQGLECRLHSYSSRKPVVLWDEVANTAGEALTAEQTDKLVETVLEAPMTCIIGPQGCGKGTAARSLKMAIEDRPERFGLERSNDCMLVHGNFSFDTDSLLEAIARFMNQRFAADWLDAIRRRPNYSRSKLFSKLELDRPFSEAQSGKRLLIILNGMERFFGTGGAMLSAELDELLRKSWRTFYPNARMPRVRWVLFGTERLRGYAEGLGMRIRDFADALGLATDGDSYLTDPVPGRYLNKLWRNTGRSLELNRPLKAAARSYRANASGRISGDSIRLRQALFDAIFDDSSLLELLGMSSRSDAVIARRILRQLAFIGTPVEFAVLENMPQVRHDGETDRTDRLRVLEQLVNKSLVLRLLGFAGYPETDAELRIGQEQGPCHPVRYVLHRSLLTELRYRFGIPLNEAKLSTSFNMSLYVAQPLDGDIPDCDLHNELGETIDALIGSYKWTANRVGGDAACAAELAKTAVNLGIHTVRYRENLREVGAVCAACDPNLDRTRISRESALRIEHLCRPEHIQSLRAALALLRSYYSTTGLLTLDSGDRLIVEDRDGILLEHAERIDDLIDGFGKLTLARKSLRAKVGADAFDAEFGVGEPFYADELVWLHNERGVVRLAMGDLHEAEHAFDMAMEINREWVERADRGHNWRRIRLNQLTIEFERGRITTASRKLDEIERVTRPSGKPSNEDRLALAIVEGYRGWVAHLGGKMAVARSHYEAAIQAFSNLKEVRGEAYFRRLYTDALDRGESVQYRFPRLQEALALAQASRQMDIVHRLNIKLADELIFGKDRSSQDHERGQRLLDDALSYALQANVHRVRCEASLTIACARQLSGDFEGALRYAMDAFMVAARYGMVLRQINLRAIIARIMAARGHPVTAEHLARTCIKMATRQQYQNAIARAERVLQGLPDISGAISRSDFSGRRRF